MNESDITSKPLRPPLSGGRVLPSLAIVFGIAALVLLINQNARQAASEQQFAAIAAKIQHLNERLAANDQSDEIAGTENLDYHTAAQARSEIAKMGASPSAAKLAEVLTLLDGWFYKSNEAAEASMLKDHLVSDLRVAIVREVNDLHQKALNAGNGQDAAIAFSEAGEVLALYPLSRDQAASNEALRLSLQHSAISPRLQTLQQQRYNEWAASLIHTAIVEYHTNVTLIGTQQEHEKLIQSFVYKTAMIDPAFLEPVVLNLYKYALDLTNNSISEADKSDLAKRLVDPKIKRKTPGDF